VKKETMEKLPSVLSLDIVRMSGAAAASLWP
jgi:hypothetical protein